MTGGKGDPSMKIQLKVAGMMAALFAIATVASARAQK